MNHRAILSAFVVLGFWTSIAEATPIIYVDQTATYRYLDATGPTVAVPVTWFTPGFNDSSWLVGNGPFSSGPTSGTIFDAANANGPFAPGPTAPVPTTFTQWDTFHNPYLRTVFTLTAPTDLTIWIAVDNGINSMYLNGVLSTGAINAEGAAFRWESVFDIPAAYTTVGANVLALQLEDHGVATGFDLMVTSNDAAVNPPFTTNPPPSGNPVPEPASLVLLGMGLVAGACRWRKSPTSRMQRTH
jgi:hypothetical protein